MHEAPKILVIRRRGLGDSLVSLDLVRALKEQWSDCHISWVIDMPFAAVFEQVPVIDELWIYDVKAMRSASAWERYQKTTAWWRRLREAKFDIVLDLLGTPQTALWTKITGAERRVGVERHWRSWAYNRLLRQEEGAPRFAGERFLDWARALDFDPGSWRPMLLPKSELRGELQEFLQRQSSPSVVFCPSATWTAKAWPAEHWAELARNIHAANGSPVLLAWGPGDEFLRDAIVRLSPDDVELFPPTSVPELLELLRGADLVITTDSGPKHLSVCAGSQTLTLFGSTNPAGWQSPVAQDAYLCVDSLPCRPCDLLDCPIEGHPCMTQLSPDRVARTALGMLREGQGVV